MGADDRNERLAAALRLAAAAAAVAIFAADPSEDPARRPLAHAVLAAFAVYSAITYLLAVRGGRAFRTSVLPWIDVAWVTLAVAASEATSGIFKPLYLFATLSASFWGGARRGLSVAAASALGFAVVGAATAPAGVDLRLFLVRPLYLLVLGALVAVWVGHEVRSRGRLDLLRAVTALSTSALGLDALVGRFLETVRAYYDADSCRLVVSDGRDGQTWTRVAVRGRGADSAATALPPDLAARLLPGPEHLAFAARLRAGGEAAFPRRAAPAGLAPADAAALLSALDARALVSVPFRYHASAPARLHVERRADRPFEQGDVDFLRQVLDQLVPIIENRRLVEHLTEEAARDERRRIALDLHDSVIQPYLGLRLGLAAARSALDAGRAQEGAALVARLLELADAELATLRGYVRELRVECPGGGAEATLRRFCRRFSETTGIRVDVADPVSPIAERLAPEVVQLVGEALSNVRRHTQASRAEVRVEAGEGRLRVTVENDGTPPGAASFLPRSIAERAVSLGGRLAVELRGRDRTAVAVELPLAPGEGAP